MITPMRPQALIRAGEAKKKGRGHYDRTKLMTEDLTAKAAELYRSGMSSYQIGRILKKSSQMILNALKAAGVPRRRGAEAQRENRPQPQTD